MFQVQFQRTLVFYFYKLGQETVSISPDPTPEKEKAEDSSHLPVLHLVPLAEAGKRKEPKKKNMKKRKEKIQRTKKR